MRKQMVLILAAAGLLFVAGCESTPIPTADAPSVLVVPAHA